MKQRRVEAERERIERRARAKRELDESLHLARLAMARDREMLLEQVERQQPPRALCEWVERACTSSYSFPFSSSLSFCHDDAQ